MDFGLGTMCSNNITAALASLSIIVVCFSKLGLAYPPVVNDGGGSNITQLNHHYSQLQPSQNKYSNHQQQQHLKYLDQNPYLGYFTTLQTNSTSTSTLSSLATSSQSDATSAKPSMQTAYIYKAKVPTNIEPEANKVVNVVKLASTTALSATRTQSPPSNANASKNSSNDYEKDGDLTKKIIGSSVVTSVSVILNGDEPEFTDALGHKVPKPQPSLQVASPIDLLNPDRYEFYTFDENGELIKRLMTMDEIQSIVANGDGEGPTIIHNGPVEDRDPEKNIRDIVNSVQNVLNKEVESNKNTSEEILPVFDTPDVSSSWSMILPAIFGNTGDVKIFPDQKPQQIVMTPDTELIETSTKEFVYTAPKKSKPNKRKPGHKQKPPNAITTTEMTPQVIQEELDSKESVYTGMQQFQHLSATMQQYDSFSLPHIQPIYHKLPDIEASTRHVFDNTQEMVKSPSQSNTSKDKDVLSENLAKKPVSVQHKPAPPHRNKKPNGEILSTKFPQFNNQKIKNKPTATTIQPSLTTAQPPSTTTPTAPIITTPIITAPPTTTTTTKISTTTTSTSQRPPTSTQNPASTAVPSSAKPPKKRKKKPTRQPIHSTILNASNETQKPHLAGEKRKPSPIQHKPRPGPTLQQNTKQPHVPFSPDLAAEGSAQQEILQNKYQYMSYHRPRPKPNKFTTSTARTTTSTIITSTTPIPGPSTTVIISPVPTTLTTSTLQVESLIIQNFTGYQAEFNDYDTSVLAQTINTRKPEAATTAKTPTISGTSGYPVPSYDTTSDYSQDVIFNQLKKQPLSSFSISQDGSKPYEQDKHTQQSFDQILQTLKQPEQNVKNISDHLIITVNNTANYGSTTFSTSLEDFEEAISSEEAAIKRKDENFTTVINSQIEHQEPNKILNIFTNIPSGNSTTKEYINSTELLSHKPFTDNIKEPTISTKVPGSSNILSNEQEIKNDTSRNDAISKLPQQPTYAYESVEAEQTTEIIKRTEQDFSGQSQIETRLPVKFPNKVETNLDDKKESNNPILVVDLKPQLNMEVIKPSEQISMSDFQTQAATVASTLVDGSITATTTDYSVMSSNKATDELVFLMSDVIKQISNSNNISKIQTTNSNDNRYSNQAQLDISFFMSHNNPVAVQPNLSSIYDNQVEDNKPFMESADSPKDQVYFNSKLFETVVLNGSQIGFNLTENASFMQNEENSSTSATERTQTTTYINRYLDSNTESTTIQSNEDNVFEATTKIYNGDENQDDDTLTLLSIEDSTSNQIMNEIKEVETTTLEVPIASLSELVEREALFEAEDSIDTTTSISGVNADTTSTEQTQTNIQIDKILTMFNNADSEESITQNIEIEPDTESTRLKDMQVSTETATETNEFTVVNAELADGLEHADYATTMEPPESTISEGTEAISTAIDTSTTQKDGIHDILEATFKISSMRNSVNESTISELEYGKENIETTTLPYQTSRETSDEFIYDDPYIKLGETTTQKLEISFDKEIQVITQSNQTGNRLSETNISAARPSIEGDMPMIAPPKPINSIIEHDLPIGTEQSISGESDDQSLEEVDEEDEEDQFGYQTQKLPISESIITTSTKTTTTTTPKPKITTTRRLNTLKPVSYFNKQPAYALYQEPAEPLYHKQSTLSIEKDYPQYKATPQQRPMHRPPQLSNLMISSNQATRPPIKLEPSPNNTKGLEASVTNLSKDILAFSKLCNELAFTYWKSITSEKISSARSLVISPFALTSMLSMVFLGARGSTSGEMNDVLKLDDMVSFNPHLIFKNITDSVEKSLDGDIATAAFVREIFSDRVNGKILQFFKEKTQQLYAGHVEEVNFHVVNDIIRRRTNLLVKRHTMGKVLEYLRTNSVWVNGPLATISGNLFQTDCTHGSTQDRDGELFFQVHPTVRQRRIVPIPAVLFKSGFTVGYEPNLDATVVAFGRIQDTTSLVYVMPEHLGSLSPTDNLDRFEKKLMETAISKNSWSNILTSLMDRPGMEVQLPRFSHRSFINATLGLQKMGLKGIFKSDYADLGGLTGSSNRDIYLSDMIQINTFSTCGEEKIADHHHVEMYPAPPLRKRNKDVDEHDGEHLDSSEVAIDFGSLVEDPVLGRGFYDDLLDPKYLELPLPLRPRQARVPDAPRLKFDKPFLYFVRHNPTGMILFMGRFNPRLLP